MRSEYWPAARRLAFLSASLVVACAVHATLGHAEDQGWTRFGGKPVSVAADQPYDHAFAKEWEAHPPKGFPTLSPGNAVAMADAIRLYTGIVARGGWRPVPETTLQPGMGGEAVGLLRERLRLSGDLRGYDGSRDGFDADLEKAVKRFQASNGLTPTGIVDKRTIAALNIPADARLRQLRVNLQRLQELTKAQERRYVVVNIPAAQIEAVENDRVVSRHAGVVGKIDRPTPLLKSSIRELNFNPVWHLPPTVIEKDLIPKGQEMAKQGQDVLSKYGIEAVGGEGRKLDSSKINWSAASAKSLTFRQQPGPENPLGFVKINFNNEHSVYMHDSPSQSLFGRNFRAASSGCVRVSGIEHLASWLLAGQGYDREKVLALKQSGQRQDVQLKKPVPLYFAYITAWATPDGVVQFRRDIYGKDGVGPVASGY